MVNTDSDQPLSDDALQSIRGASVLVAEDSKINQQIAEEFLSEVRIQATIVNDGQEAVDAIKKQHFDIVLMDIQMPVMDGFEATRIIRDIPKYSELPIIAMTADGKDDDRERCLAAGLSDHVVKSLDPENLYKVLIKWIKSTQRADVPVPPRATEENVELPDNLPGIDLSIGIRIVRSNTALLRKLLLEFYAEHHTDIKILYQAIQNNNDTLAKRIVHTLVSTAGSIGAVELRGAAYELDDQLRECDLKSVSNGVSKLEKAFIPVMNGLREFSEKELKKYQDSFIGSEADAENFDVNAAFKLIDELAGLISGFSPESERTARELQCMLHYNDIKPESIERLIEQLAAFDFSDAEKTLIKLVDELQILL